MSDLLREMIRTIISESQIDPFSQPSREFIEAAQIPVNVEIFKRWKLPPGFTPEGLQRWVHEEYSDKVDEWFENYYSEHLPSVATDEDVMRHYQEFQNYAKGLDPNLRMVAQEISKLNPDLAPLLETSDGISLSGLLIGIASGFNADDIRFFQEEWKGLNDAPPLWREKWERVQELYGVEGKFRGGWIPSTKTLDALLRAARVHQSV